MRLDNPAQQEPQEVQDATLLHFQVNAGTGTATTPDQVNDNNTATTCTTNAVDQYAEVDFDRVVRIRRWRQYGQATNDGTGRWTIQYWDIISRTWVDWVTGIVCRITADWSTLTTEVDVVTTGIRLVCAVVDHAAFSSIGELEVYY